MFLTNIFIFVVLLSVLNCVYSQTVDNKRQTQLRKVYKSICGPKLSKDTLKDVRDCEESLPDLVSSNFKQCVKEVMKVNKFTKPLLCYRGQGGDKLKSCLLRRARALSKKAPPFINLESLRNRILDKYTKCLVDVI